MKRLFTLFITAVLVCTGMSAQRAELRKVAERYKDANTFTATVRQTRHNAALTKDAVTNGRFYYKKPDNQSMVFKDTKEMLLATGNTFVMVKKGKKYRAKANAKGSNPFEILREVFRNLLSTNDNAALANMADVKLEKKGNNTCTITIVPTAAKGSKAKRKTMFTSCVATVNLKTSELRSLRINEQRGNYTRYDFSNYAINAEVSNSVFNTNIVM